MFALRKVAKTVQRNVRHINTNATEYYGLRHSSYKYTDATYVVGVEAVLFISIATCVGLTVGEYKYEGFYETDSPYGCNEKGHIEMDFRNDPLAHKYKAALKGTKLESAAIDFTDSAATQQAAKSTTWLGVVVSDLRATEL